MAPCPSNQTYSRQADDEKWLLSPEPGLTCADPCPSSLPPGHTCSGTAHLHVASEHTRGPQPPPSRLLLVDTPPSALTHALVVTGPIRNLEGWARKLLRTASRLRAGSMGYTAPSPKQSEAQLCSVTLCVRGTWMPAPSEARRRRWIPWRGAPILLISLMGL